jgi:glucokinase
MKGQVEMDSPNSDGLEPRPTRVGTLPTGRPVAAIDIGGTSIKAALFLGADALRHEFRVPTPRLLGPDAVVRAVIDTAMQLIDIAQRQLGTSPRAMGVACLGLVDDLRGSAIYSAAVGWRDVPLVDLLQSRLHIPVVLRQDIRAAAYAETTGNSSLQRDPALFVAIGTGIGGAITTGGLPQSGAHHRAGEIGHIQVRLQEGRRCRCGGIGCMESYSSASAIAATASAALGRAVEAPEVVSAATAGETWAVQIWHEAIQVLAQGLSGAILLIDPARIVIGGGLSLAGPALLDPLRQELADLYQFGEPPPIDLARFGDTGALRGAATSAFDLLRNTVGAR